MAGARSYGNGLQKRQFMLFWAHAVVQLITLRIKIT